MRAVLLVVASGLLLVPTSGARGVERCVTADDFRVGRGELRAGKGCGVLIGETDGAALGFSYGEFAWREPVAVPLRVSLRWRRLSSESTRALELQVPGAVVLLRDRAWGVYVDDARFAVDGWHDLPGYTMQRESEIVVERDARGLTLWVDGRRAGAHTLATPSTSGTVAVALKGPTRQRARMLLHDFSVVSLAQRQ